MSIAAAIMANMQGDAAGAERELGKVLLKSAVMHEIFCPACGVVMDIKRAVLAESKTGSKICCGSCWDIAIKARAAANNVDAATYLTVAAAAGLTVHDGRVLHAKKPRSSAPRRKRTILQGTATNTVTGEQRAVAISETLAATLLDDSTDECTGPCKCEIEPDGICPKFWPSRMRALGLV